VVFIPFSELSFAKGPSVIPRFVTIKSGEANMRTGPSVRYPIEFVYIKKGEPVEVLSEFEHWRKVRDHQGDVGWIHENMLSGKRTVIIQSSSAEILYKKADASSKMICQVEPAVKAKLLKCKNNWCFIQADSYKGWIERNKLWGVYPNEEIE
jgi:SH3-like domain-containing protein